MFSVAPMAVNQKNVHVHQCAKKPQRAMRAELRPAYRVICGDNIYIPGYGVMSARSPASASTP